MCACALCQKVLPLELAEDWLLIRGRWVCTACCEQMAIQLGFLAAPPS